MISQFHICDLKRRFKKILHIRFLILITYVNPINFARDARDIFKNGRCAPDCISRAGDIEKDQGKYEKMKRVLDAHSERFRGNPRGHLKFSNSVPLHFWPQLGTIRKTILRFSKRFCLINQLGNAFQK